MFNYFKELSVKYNVPLENVLSIALNRYGLIIDGYPDNRIRFNLSLLDSNKKDYFAVCVNTYDKSPFSMKGDKLYLEDSIVGKISDLEKDTCTSTYFRNDNKVITFNSNSRSKCKGCAFCGTYSLSEDDTFDFSKKENVQDYFNALMKSKGIEGMNKIENVTLCTGCFDTEDALYDHIMLLNESFKELGFNGSINYIGSQLRDYDKIASLSKEVGDFGIYLTIEKFLDREKFMKPEKSSLTLPKAKELLEYCSSIGVTNTFLYILGLEDLDTVKKYFDYYKDSINKFPIVQVFQDYTPYQEAFRCEEAKDVEYYLKGRQIIDDTFKDKSLNPKLWENFRGLYYEKEEKPMELVKCKKLKTM